MSDEPLFIVKGAASPAEVAALTVVLQALSGLPSSSTPAPTPRPVWSAPSRLVRGPLAHGPGGWRATSLPR